MNHLVPLLQKQAQLSVKSWQDTESCPVERHRMFCGVRNEAYCVYKMIGIYQLFHLLLEGQQVSKMPACIKIHNCLNGSRKEHVYQLALEACLPKKTAEQVEQFLGGAQLDASVLAETILFDWLVLKYLYVANQKDEEYYSNLLRGCDDPRKKEKYTHALEKCHALEVCVDDRLQQHHILCQLVHDNAKHLTEVCTALALFVHGWHKKPSSTADEIRFMNQITSWRNAVC